MASSVDIDKISADIAPRLSNAVNSIMMSSLSRSARLANLKELLLQVGSHFKSKTYDDLSTVVDSTIRGGDFTDSDTTQAGQLATKLARNYALERGVTTETLITSYLSSILESNKYSVMANARSLNKHPTLTRSIVSETCEWCQARAGTYTDPPREAFQRHSDCDCLIYVSGYNSRNGFIKNYRKAQK